MKLSQMKGKEFKCVKLYGGRTVEDIPQMRESIQRQVRSYNLNEKDVSKHTEMTETKDHFNFSNSNKYVIKPKVHRKTNGMIEFRRGGDYIFHYDDKKSYGEKLKASMLVGNILKVSENLTYEIELN